MKKKGTCIAKTAIVESPTKPCLPKEVEFSKQERYKIMKSSINLTNQIDEQLQSLEKRHQARLLKLKKQLEESNCFC